MNYENYPDLSNVEKILVIKLRNLGDLLLTTPVFSSLKKRFPKAKIDAYIYEEGKEILLDNPSINQIICYNQSSKKFSFFKKIFYELKLLFLIRKNRYDLVINLTEGDRGAIASFFSKAKVRVGEEKKAFKDRLFTHLYKTCKNQRHSVERNLDVLRRIGIFPKEEEKNLVFVISEEVKNKMKNFLEKKGFLEKKFILIHPTSRWRFKSPPKKLFIDLSKKLLEKGFSIIFVSGKESYEKKMIQEIGEELPKGNFLVLEEELSIKELGALILLCQKMICVDSFSLHLASGFLTKCTVLFGPTSEINWGPWKNPNIQIVTSNFSCRPCGLDGCGGSKKSLCLENICEAELLLNVLKNL